MSLESALAGTAPWHVEKADCIDFLSRLPDGSVDLLFCSPPYESARLYLEDGKDMGIARDADEWAVWMLQVCFAARRACKGLCAFVVEGRTKRYRYSCTPFLLMADLHRAGFCLRKPPIYRRVGIPGSGGPDWLRNDYEPVVCFTTGGRLPWSDNTAMGAPPVYGPGGEMSNQTRSGRRKRSFKDRGDKGGCGETQSYTPPALANPGNIIDCHGGGGHLGSALAHENEAPFPESLAEFFVRSFCPEGGVVCDPFMGSCTTGAVATRWARRFLGCDLRQSQVDLSLRRLAEEKTLFDEAASNQTAPPEPLLFSEDADE